jgi:hypothetical protein
MAAQRLLTLESLLQKPAPDSNRSKEARIQKTEDDPGI